MQLFNVYCVTRFKHADTSATAQRTCPSSILAHKRRLLREWQRAFLSAAPIKERT